MLARTIIDKNEGRKWEIYRKSDNEFFYKYYEYYNQSGWRLIGREGDHIKGYLSKECIEYDFDIAI